MNFSLRLSRFKRFCPHSVPKAVPIPIKKCNNCPYHETRFRSICVDYSNALIISADVAF